MTDPQKSPAADGPGIPRDMPDQQADGPEEEDRWAAGRTEGEDRDEDVPDTDEAGTRRRGDPRGPGVHPDQPTPDEPTG